MANDLGLRISHFRQRRGISQSELAERAGMSQASISRIENAPELDSLDAEIISRISFALGVPIQVLLEGRSDSASSSSENHGDLPPAHEEFWTVCTNPTCADNEISFRRGRGPQVEWNSWEEHEGTVFAEINFCSECGSKLLKQCPKCGKWFDRGEMKFCMRCGSKIFPEFTKEQEAALLRRRAEAQG